MIKIQSNFIACTGYFFAEYAMIFENKNIYKFYIKYIFSQILDLFCGLYIDKIIYLFIAPVLHLYSALEMY